MQQDKKKGHQMILMLLGGYKMLMCGYSDLTDSTGSSDIRCDCMSCICSVQTARSMRSLRQNLRFQVGGLKMILGCGYPSRKLTDIAPENGWLEDDPLVFRVLC